MKPKTQLEKETVALSAKLRPITEKQKKWAFKNSHIHYGRKSRNTLFCHECGHSWKVDKTFDKESSPICPCCSKKLTLTKSWFTIHRSYFGILTTKNRNQVIRIFSVQKTLKGSNKAELSISEVIQHWITPTGEITSLSKSTNNMSQYYDCWDFSSNLEIRMDSYRDRLRNDIAPEKFYPIRSILPEIRRNGYNGKHHGFTEQKLFSMLLKDRKAETLIKTGQIPMLKYYNNSRNIDILWNSIKICIRNNYIIPDASLWEDYIELLRFFGKDTLNAKFVCPVNLKQEHDKLLEKKREYNKQQKLKEKAEQIEKEEEEYRISKEKFLNLCFNSKNITIEPLRSVRDFLLEGETHHHCVFENDYFKKENSLILSAKVNDEPAETIELSLKTLKVVQSRGKFNQPSKHHKQILSLMNRSIPKVAALL
ncbi:MAG TPA: PcfJ domain-containing protein [Tenuifilaceae bacterium]|nr:PcfJ domain-containing protein [Tenuifilaceae bacterium]